MNLPGFPVYRPRRLRQSPALRKLVCETRLSVEQLVLPLFAAVSATVIISLTMTNIYQAKAVIMPVTAKDSGAGNTGLAVLAQQFGGLPGISTPGAASAAVWMALRSALMSPRVRSSGMTPMAGNSQFIKRPLKSESRAMNRTR